MCLSPILLKNPNQGANYFIDVKGKKVHVSNFKDVKSQFIRVPCGKCPECVKMRQLGYIQRSQLMEFEYYPFFCTLTYNDDSLPVLELDYPIHYAKIEDIQLFFKRLRNSRVFGDRAWKYLAVSEFGSRFHRPHWHILFFVQRQDSDDEFTPYNLEFSYYSKVLSCWCRNVGCKKKPVYIPLLTIPKRVTADGRSPYDFHYVHTRQSDSSDVSFYVTKYVLKIDPYVKKLRSAILLNYSKEDAKTIWKIIKPKFVMSKHFGFPESEKQKEHIEKGLALTDTLPVFINPNTGFTFPLAPYVKKRLPADVHLSHMSLQTRTDSGEFIMYYDEKKNRKQIIEKFEKQSYQILNNLNRYE